MAETFHERYLRFDRERRDYKARVAVLEAEVASMRAVVEAAVPESRIHHVAFKTSSYIIKRCPCSLCAAVEAWKERDHG
jgi:hypothetical protein